MKHLLVAAMSLILVSSGGLVLTNGMARAEVPPPCILCEEGNPEVQKEECYIFEDLGIRQLCIWINNDCMMQSGAIWC